MSVTNIHDSSSTAARRSARRGIRAASTQGASDAELVELVRNGDPSAFGELWNRHSAAGVAAARSITSRFDPEDLSAEAFTRILQAIKDGKGPRVAFRPYLYTSIRNISINWTRDRGHETPSEDVDDFASIGNTEDDALARLERSTSNRAYNSLPTRWQEALWYSEVEGLAPRHIAPLLGMKAGAVSALLFRARGGLREAWIQEHLTTLSADSECRWVVGNLAASTRSTLAKREQKRLDAHLPGCASCTLVSGEAEQLNTRLALVILPLAIGIPGTAAFTAWLQSGAATTAVAAAAPASLAGTGSGSTVTSVGKLGGGATMPAVAAAAAVVVVSASALFGVTQLVGAGGEHEHVTNASGQETPAVPPPTDLVEQPAEPIPIPIPIPPVLPEDVPGPEQAAPPASEQLQAEPLVPPVIPRPDPPVVPPVIPPVDTTAEAPTLVLGARDPGRGPATIEGSAEAGATVSVYRDDVILGETAADKSGAWTLSLSTEVDPGSYLFTATQRDMAGNISPASAAVEITVYGLTLTGSAALENVHNYTLTVSGEPLALVDIVGVNSIDVVVLAATVTLDDTGTWTGHPDGITTTNTWVWFTAAYSGTIEPPLISEPVSMLLYG